MEISFPRLGIESIKADITEESQHVTVKTIDSNRIASSADLRLLARELVALADEIDAASPTQEEIARKMTKEERDEES